MANETTDHLKEAIVASLKDGSLYIDWLKDPNSDCQVDIQVGNATYTDCKEVISHYRDKNTMLAYTTIEIIATEERYYYLEIRDYSKAKTLQNQTALHTVLSRNSCFTATARSW